jgi:REP element-mobilizing transposase RayT
MANAPLLDEAPDAAHRAAHGGWRKGAGRKPSARPPVLHRTRPLHWSRHPSHVTVPFLRSVARGLRQERVFAVLRRIFRTPKIEGFQVVHYSVQDDHVHLVVEAVDGDAFSSGMRSLCIRAALRLNALFGRKGKVLRDRYHRRDLFSARQVRDVLRYVLLNGVRHQVLAPGELDPFSSAFSFDGWHEVDPARQRPRAIGDPRRAVMPWTRLLASEWRALGPISPYEAVRFAPLSP